MQEVTPSDVPIAVKIVMMVWMTNFQMLFLLFSPTVF